jgi:putative addiction module killer protein
MYIVRETEEFRSWLDALVDRVARIRIAARLRYAEAGNLGDWAPVKGDVSEMRIDFGPGYRLYFCRRGSVLIAMLCGGIKSTQKRDIRKATRISAELGEDL